MDEHAGVLASRALLEQVESIAELIKEKNWDAVIASQVTVIKMMDTVRSFPLLEEQDMQAVKLMLEYQRKAFDLLRHVRDALEKSRDELKALVLAAENQKKNGGYGSVIQTDVYSLSQLSGRRKR